MKTKHTLMILGGLLAGAATLIPMTSYADEKTGNADVMVSVAPSITIKATSGTPIPAEIGKVAEGTFTAEVTSNQAYTIAISAATTDKTNMTRQKEGGGDIDNPGTNDRIPAKGGADLTEGVIGWGIKKKVGSSDADEDTFTAVGTSINDESIFYHSSTLGTKTTTFTVGVGTTSALNSGTYSTEVILTASTNGSN